MLLSDLSALLGVSLEGNGDIEINGVAGLREAAAGEVSVLMNPKYAGLMATTKASAVIVAPSWTGDCPASLLRSEHPEQAFTLAAETFSAPLYNPPPGIHPTAVIADDVLLDDSIHVGAHAVIETGVRLGRNVKIMAQSWVGPCASLGDDCRIYPQVTIREHTRIGDRVIIHSGSVIGADGFGYSVDSKGVRTKIPQIGIVWIEDDVEIGSNVTIDRARFGKTRIGRGVKIDNLVQVAHNVIVGDHSVLVAQVGISGSTVLGKGVIMAGQAGAAGHLTIGDGAIVGGQAGVTHAIPAKAYVFGTPAVPFDKFTKGHIGVQRLPQLKRRISELEERLAALEAKK